MIELEALDRTLKCLEHLEVGEHGRRRLDGIRALALACQLPLQEFLKRIKKLENCLGSWNANMHSFSAINRRLCWSAKYKDEAKALRARLAPNLATITVLLMTQTVDSLSTAGSNSVRSVQQMNHSFYVNSRTLAALKNSTDRVEATQHILASGQSQFSATALKQDQNLQTLKSKADELIQKNASHSGQLREQTTILKAIQENSVTMESQTRNSLALTTSISEDVSTIKLSIPSILGRTLDLLNTVAYALSSLQDITNLMHRMIELMTRFTVEMRETMAKLLRAFWEIQKQLARLETLMHRRICPPTVIFRDAFNVMRSFPYDLSREWRTFQGLVTVAFTGRQGLQRVNMGQYSVTNSRLGQRLNPAFWSNAIEPGDELSMIMILDDIEAEEGFCPYKSCGASTAGVAETRNGKICPNCFRVATISRKKEVQSSSYDDGESSGSYHESSRLGLDGEVIPLQSPNTHERHETGLQRPLPPPVLEEDIELYYAIEVTQALLNGKHETGCNSGEKSLQDSVYEAHSINLSTSSLSMQIFVKNLGGLPLTLMVHSSNLVAYLKVEIEFREGIQRDRQNLMFAGKVLENGRTLAWYNIQNNDTLHLVLEPRNELSSNDSDKWYCVSMPFAVRKVKRPNRLETAQLLSRVDWRYELSRLQTFNMF